MSKESEQVPEAPRKFKLGPLGNLNQVMVALGKTIRAMAIARLTVKLALASATGWASCANAWRRKH
jgi:mRNA-degrading endonuclease toxin of MazEF toxin-antitoxin module